MSKILTWLGEHHLFIILPLIGLFVTAGVIFWTQTRQLPEPMPFNQSAELGAYCATDVELLSKWIVKVDGEEIHSFYSAADSGGNPYIVSLNDEQYQGFTEIVAYTYSDRSGAKPVPEHVSGMVVQLQEEEIQYLADSLDLGRNEFVEIFGKTFLNGKADPNTDIVVGCIWAIGICFLTFAFAGIFTYVEWSDRRQEKRGTYGGR